MQRELHDHESVYSGRDIIEHDPTSFWQSFELSDGRRLENVEDSKKYKTGGESLPRERYGDQGYELSCHFVDDNEAGIFCARPTSDQRCCGNADGRHDNGEADNNGRPHRNW